MFPTSIPKGALIQIGDNSRVRRDCVGLVFVSTEDATANNIGDLYAKGKIIAAPLEPGFVGRFINHRFREGDIILDSNLDLVVLLRGDVDL